MLYGMGTVFVFLTILVFATAAMSRFVLTLSKQDEVAPTAPVTAVTSSADTPSPQIMEAIKQAIKEHRRNV